MQFRDPDTIIPERIEGALITALDNENDSAIAAQIQATLQTLLRAGASSAPSYWLSVCSSVALAAPPSAGFANDLPSGDIICQRSSVKSLYSHRRRGALHRSVPD